MEASNNLGWLVTVILFFCNMEEREGGGGGWKMGV